MLSGQLQRRPHSFRGTWYDVILPEFTQVYIPTRSWPQCSLQDCSLHTAAGVWSNDKTIEALATRQASRLQCICTQSHSYDRLQLLIDTHFAASFSCAIMHGTGRKGHFDASQCCK